MTRTNQVFLHTGSNLGDRFANLERANQLIEQRVGPIQKRSSYYETDAWGVTDQPIFINQALVISTEMSPLQVLKSVLKIEQEMGRVRVKKWAERLIDIDILFYNDEIIETPRLNIPHIRIQERNFVLVPMAEIAPNWLHPVFQKNISQLLEISQDPLKVHKMVQEPINPIFNIDFIQN